MNYRTMIIGVVMFAAVAIISGAAMADDRPPKRFVATIDKDGYQRVEMTAGEYYYDPSIVVVKVNVPVELAIKKTGGVAPHNLVMKAPEAGLDFTIDIASEPRKVAFMATKTGTYAFECSKRFLFFKSHKDRGMHGTLEVVE